MTIQKTRCIVKPIKPKTFLGQAAQAQFGDTFCFQDELLHADPATCRPHIQGVLAIQHLAHDCYVHISGRANFNPLVPSGARCFSFYHGFVYLHDTHLITLLENRSGSQRWREKILYEHTETITDCYECETGDIYIVDVSRNITRVLGSKSLRERAARSYHHRGELIPIHAWDDMRIVGEHVWTRHGRTFYCNGKERCTFLLTPPEAVWENSWQWFISTQNALTTVVVACPHTKRERDMNNTLQARTTTFFYAADDSRLLFEESDSQWQLCQAGKHIAMYNIATSEIKIAGRGENISVGPFSKIYSHFVGMILVKSVPEHSRLSHIIVVPVH